MMIFTEAFGTTWTKQYCTYQKDKKEFTMIPYNQLTGKFVSKSKKMIVDDNNNNNVMYRRNLSNNL